MQPGYPGSGQDPYGQQPPYSDPYAQPQYPNQPQQPPQPPYQDPYAQPQAPYQDPYAQPQAPYQDPYAQPTSGSPYPQPTSGSPYPQPTPGNPYPAYPGAQQYPMAGYGAPGGQPQQSNTLGLLSMIFGIIGLVSSACCGVFGIALSITAVITGVLGLKKANQGLASNRGQALAGIICGAIALVISIVAIILYGALNISNLTNNY